MADYIVNYDINVIDNGSAAINSFTAAVRSMSKVTKEFDKINSKLNTLKQRMWSFENTKAPKITINTTQAIKNVDKLIGRLNQLKALAKEMNMPMSAVVGQPTTDKKSGKTGGSSKTSGTTARKGAARPRTLASTRYRALGQTLMDTGGVGVLDFAKGMGIAYGIAGLGTLASNVIKDSAEYNNIIQTTKNILSTHDYKGNFSGRFQDMEKLVRQVGVQTKFTAPQVADATKFLAMAGFDIDAINKSIRPIADIALIGDDDLGQTADVVTNIMTGYGISPDKVRNAADIMTMTFTKSNTTLMEIAESYKYAASLLSLNGTSFEEATAAIGILGNAGIKGSQAGTTLRTLAMNIAKPTKAQAEMWDKLGISRTDGNGNIRPLIEIFSDLNQKQLNLSQIGSLFHKTAAQGAASLAAHVDDWNEIIRENFLSDGVAQKLADAKKNTIQGLWYQITSSFTEAGMRAFEAQESPIRNIMKRAIGWLQSDSAMKLMNNFAKFIADIGKTLAEFTKIIVKFVNKFQPLITTWLKLQLFSKLVMVPARAISAVKGFGNYLLAIGNASASAAVQVNKLISSVSLLNRINLLPKAPKMWGGHTSEVWERWSRITGRATPWALIGGIGATAGMIGGGALGGMLGEKGGIWNNIWSLLGGGLGAIGGNFIFGKLATLLPTIIKFFAGPAGWISLGATVITGATVAIIKHINKLNEARDAMLDYYDSTKMLNGINISDHATQIDKYLTIVNDKQLSANEALSKYIALRKEELGLNVPDLGDDGKKATKDMEHYSSLFGGKPKFFGQWSLSKIVDSLSLGERLPFYAISDGGENVELVKPYLLNGQEFNLADKYDAKRALAAETLFRMGYDTTKGSETQKLIDSYTTDFLRAKSTTEFNQIQSNLQTYLSERIANADRTLWSASDIPNNPFETNSKSLQYTLGMAQAIDEVFSRPEHAKNLYYQILDTIEKGYEVPQSLKESFLEQAVGYNFDNFGSKEWLERYGFINGDWVGGKYIDHYDKDGKAIEKEYSASTAASHFKLALQDLTNFIRALQPEFQGLFKDFIDIKHWNPSNNKLMGNNKIAQLDGVNYQYNADDGMWYPPVPMAPISDSEMAKRRQARGLPSIWGEEDETQTGNDKSSLTSSTKDANYENVYKSSVVPKQIIVKIENLMNVASIDMTDPNVSSTVNNLKQQMAQALIEVVADFDANASNLV